MEKSKRDLSPRLDSTKQLIILCAEKPCVPYSDLFGTYCLNCGFCEMKF